MKALRLRALDIARSQIGTHEVGFNNRGPKVDQYQKADNLPGVGYPWCASFVQWCFMKAGKPLPNRTASVGFLLDWAKRRGYTVQRPFRGDLICFFFGPDSWPDHIGFVERVLALPSPRGWRYIIRTIEGNTSANAFGSQSDGGGVYRRTRWVAPNKVAFIRIPN